MLPRFLILLSLVFGIPVQGIASPDLAGDYRGVLSLTSSDHDLLTRLVVVTRRDEGNDLKLQGYLTFYLGSFESGEYVTYTFDDISFNLLSSELVFEQTDQAVIVRGRRGADGMLNLEIQSPWLGSVGSVALKRDNPAVLSRPAMPHLAGTYRGQCGGIDQTLILQTLRLGDGADASDGFGVYEVSGRLGMADRGLCPNARNRHCAKNMIESGRYNFFTGEVELNGRQMPLDCRFRSGILRCGDCDYIGDEPTTQAGTQVAPQLVQPVWGEVNKDMQIQAPLEGAYKGFLHIEGRDLYVPAAIQLMTYRDSVDGSNRLQISAVARFMFDQSGTRETKIMRFERQGFNLQAGQFQLSHPEQQHDARPLFTVMNGQRLAGTWHSLIAGRVGTFVLDKVGTAAQPSVPDDKKVVPLSSRYRASDMTMQLAARRDGSNTAQVDPFSPLSLSGYFWFQSGIVARISIERSAYDFYTGKIGFILNDGRRMVTGWQSNDGTIALRWQTKVYGGLIADGPDRRFRGEGR